MSNDIQRAVVLVVEDVDWIREGMARRLKACGFGVAEAADADAALAQAEILHPAAILTEEELPSYARLVALLARHPPLARIPVVIINPDAEPGARLGDTLLLPDYLDLQTLLAVKN